MRFPDWIRAWAWLGQVALVAGGWALVTWGVARLTVAEVWPISAGLFLLLLAGVRYLAALFGTGLFVLSRESDRA